MSENKPMWWPTDKNEWEIWFGPVGVCITLLNEKDMCYLAWFGADDSYNAKFYASSPEIAQAAALTWAREQLRLAYVAAGGKVE